MFNDTDKDAFAKTWATVGDPWKAALTLSPEDAGRALQLDQLQFDAYVVSKHKEYIAQCNPGDELPDKTTIAKAILVELTECRTKDAKVKFYKLYCEVMGYIVKGADKGTAGIVAVPLSAIDEKL